jgi:hypothetical protein
VGEPAGQGALFGLVEQGKAMLAGGPVGQQDVRVRGTEPYLLHR